MKKMIMQLSTGLIAWLSISTASAFGIGSYELQTKASGDEIPFMFGFRLDGSLAEPTKEYTAYYDFVDSDMTLTNDGKNVFIKGKVHAGDDDGRNRTVLRSWNLNFVYDIADTDDDDVDLHLMSSSHGDLKAFLKDFSIADVSGLPYMLVQNKMNHISDKMGAMKHGSTCKLSTCDWWQYKDWLFDIKHPTPAVPVPAPVWLLSSGLFALVAVARRASKQS